MICLSLWLVSFYGSKISNKERIFAPADEQARAKKERSPDSPLKSPETVRHVIYSDSDDDHVVPETKPAGKVSKHANVHMLLMPV